MHTDYVVSWLFNFFHSFYAFRIYSLIDIRELFLRRPDINAIKAGLLGNPRSVAPAPVSSSSLVDASYTDVFRRQASLSGEDIKIVIDDVDQLDLDQTPSTYIIKIFCRIMFEHFA